MVKKEAGAWDTAVRQVNHCVSKWHIALKRLVINNSSSSHAQLIIANVPTETMPCWTSPILTRLLLAQRFGTNSNFENVQIANTISNTRVMSKVIERTFTIWKSKLKNSITLRKDRSSKFHFLAYTTTQQQPKRRLQMEFTNLENFKKKWKFGWVLNQGRWDLGQL